jgi:hypothetical protein
MWNKTVLASLLALAVATAALAQPPSGSHPTLDQTGVSPTDWERFWAADPTIRGFVGLSEDGKDAHNADRRQAKPE